MKKAFDEGWGAVIAKTVSLDSSKVSNPCTIWNQTFSSSDLF
jgi:hypothetical protein